MRVLRIDQNSFYRQLIGVDGIGSGIFFELEGNVTLGRNESRPGRLLGVRDYCKLHIVIHYVAKLLGARVSGSRSTYSPSDEWGKMLRGRQVVKEMTEAGIDTRSVHATPSTQPYSVSAFNIQTVLAATSPLATPRRQQWARVMPTR